MKLVVIDECPIIREGIKSIFEMKEQFEICGEASTVNRGIDVIKQQKPDLVLIDIRVGKENGLDIIKKTRHCDCKYLVLTSSKDKYDFKAAQHLGIDGYMFKNAYPEDIVYAVSMINRGRKYYDSSLLACENDDLCTSLTKREREILSLIAEGKKNKQIAKEFYISEGTVKKHVSQILSKLSLSDRTQAALYASSKHII